MIADIPDEEMETMELNLGDCAIKSSKKSKSSKSKTVQDAVSPVGNVSITWLRNGFPVPLKPDGRACQMCSRRDSSDDPVSLAQGIKEPMWWGHTPYPDGTTFGYDCGYCVRMGRAKAKEGVSLSKYKKQLGDEAKLDMHRMRVDKSIERLIQTGSRNAHLDWGEIDQQVVDEVETTEFVTKRPLPEWAR